MTAAYIFYENALKFIRKCEDGYDLIIVDSCEPFGPSEGLFTHEDFTAAASTPCARTASWSTSRAARFLCRGRYRHAAQPPAHCQHLSVGEVYQAHIPTFAAGYWLFGFASKKYHPINDMDADAWNALNMRTRYYTSRLHVGAFYLPAFLEEMLREVEEH